MKNGVYSYKTRMRKMTITTLFLDIGGVILTNGWDHVARKKAVEHFCLDEREFDLLHQKFYDRHEKGELTLDHYLTETVFWKPRPFSRQTFKDFMKAQSQPHLAVIEFIKKIKKKYCLRIVVISNEGRELAEYRIKTFGLNSFVDAFFVSCFVRVQKPDPFIFHLALDTLQLLPKEVFYIDDRDYLVKAAAKLGLHGVTFTSLENVESYLSSLDIFS